MKIYTDTLSFFGLKQLIFLFVLFQSSINDSFSQKKLSLEEAISIGLQNDFSIQIAQKTLNISQNNRKMGISERFPSISFNAFQNNYYNNINNPTSFVRGIYGDNQINYDISANYIIYNGKQNSIKQKQLNTLFFQQEKVFSQSKNQVKYTISKQYFQVIKENEKLKVLIEIKELSKFRVRDLELQKNLGRASQYEVLRAKNSFLLDSVSLIQQTKIYQDELLQLNILLGFSKIEYSFLTDGLLYQPKNFSLSELQLRLIKNNLELKNLNSEITFSQLENSIWLSKKRPIIGINSKIGQLYSTTKFENQPFISGFTNNLFLGFYLSFPLFDGYEIKQNIINEKINTSIKTLKFNELQRKLVGELASAYQNYTYSIKIIELNQTLLNSMNETLNFQKNRSDFGISNYMEFRNVQLEYIQANYSFLEAVFQLKILEAEIDFLVSSN